MKICIPIKVKSQGGMHSFIANFSGYLQSHSVPFTADVEDDYDVLFVNSWAVDYKVVRRIKWYKPRIKVVQRVDGSARDYGRFGDADERQARVNMLTDLTIFQSHYSKYSTMEKFKVISQDGLIIYNPVDTNLFSPGGEKLSFPYRVKVCHVTFSTNPKKGAREVYKVARANPDIDFILCGRYDDLPQIANIHFLGYLGRKEIATVVRSCDVFFHPAQNDTCPNVVLEALASGLPILYKASGGTPELVGDCGLPVEVSNFREQLEKVLSRRGEFSQAARARALEHFSPGVIFPQYLKAIEQAERRALPTAGDFIKASLQGYPVMPYSPRQVAYGTQWVRRAFLILMRSLIRRG